MKKYIVIIFGFIMVGFGSALTVRAGVGMGAWDAAAKSVADIFAVEVGTASMLFNIICVLGQFVILRKNFHLIQLLQIPFSILLGMIINYVAYDLYTFQADSLISGLLLYLLANTISALGVAMVMLVNKIPFALEGFCMAISRIFPIRFHIIRQFADILSLTVVFLFTYLFSIPLSVGVGTVMGMLIFGPSLGLFMKVLKPIFDYFDLIDPLVQQQSVIGRVLRNRNN